MTTIVHTKYLHEIIEEAASRHTKKKRAEVLQKYSCMGLHDILKIMFDERLEPSVPIRDSVPPYTPSRDHNHPSELKRESRQFVHFFKNQGKPMNPIKRDVKFIQFLEGIHPKDAELVIAAMRREIPKGLDEEVVRMAFPDLIDK